MVNSKKLKEFDFSQIKIVLTDIDGVWTDGGLYYTAEGLVMKRFNVKDGMGVNLLREKGIETGIVSGDNSELINTRGRRLKLELIYLGSLDKKKILDEICTLRNLTYDNVAYIGDDVNDLDMIRTVGLTAAPADAVPEVLELVDYICRRKGGDACFREFADLIRNSIDIKTLKAAEGVKSL